MKRFFKLSTLCLVATFLILSFKPPTVSHAASAPPLTSYKILGYSDPSVAGTDPNTFYFKPKGSDYIVSGSTVYIVDEIYGWSTIQYAQVDGISTNYKLLHQYFITGTYKGIPNTIIGSHDVYEFDNIPTGTHTFNIKAVPTINATPPLTPLSDSITLQVQN